jgi:uncharacterized damage-inducible protein DinB
MNPEILEVTRQLKDTYEGEPWFGRNAKALLQEAGAVDVFHKPNGQHSLLHLLWHMITWREFTLSRLQPTAEKNSLYFEQRDWQIPGAANENLWHDGLKKLEELQNELVEVLQAQKDSLLTQTVPERTYPFRTLLYGIVQHDIYHLGQIAYLTKLLRG